MSTTKTSPAGKFCCTSPTPAGLTLPCPACKEPIACFALHLARTEDDNCFTCGECNAEFGFDHMRLVVNAWAKFLPRVAAMMALLADDLDGIEDAGSPEEAE